MSEGFPNSAEQATLLGKNAILSNINVHLEERKKNYFFFKYNDHKKLAQILNSKVKSSNIKKNYEKIYLSRQKKFIKKFENFILNNINK